MRHGKASDSELVTRRLCTMPVILVASPDYLASRGVPVDRLSTISYGEERPKYDNSREETRRLNRRAALVVNLQR